jgi:hypothetical protein
MMCRRRQFVLAERTDTGRPQAAASSDSAALVSAADSAADSAGESVTKERYNPCVTSKHGELESRDVAKRRLIVEVAAEVWGE